MKKGFTLVELLVVVGIIAVLISILVPYSRKAIENAEMRKCSGIVKQTETALAALFDQSEAWPQCLIGNSNKKSGLDETAAYPLASQVGMSLSSDSGTKKLKGLNRFGILTTWGAAVVKDRGTKCTLGTAVPVGGTVADHRLFYALDLDGDGKIEGVNPAAMVPGLKGADARTVSIRATAAVWCRGPKGRLIKSWTDMQTQNVN